MSVCERKMFVSMHIAFVCYEFAKKTLNLFYI